MGYEIGYSMAALPYDFKESYCRNDDFASTFAKLVEELYKNTGKKVTIIAHSYGNLNSYFNILAKELQSKIENYIAIAPPFGGAHKAADLIFRGSTEYEVKYTGINFTPFAMGIAFPNMGVGAQLLSYNYLETTKADSPNLSTAFGKYLEYSTCMMENNMDEECLTNKQPIISLLPDVLGWMNNDKICSVRDSNRELLKKKFNKDVGANDIKPTSDPCDFMFIDFNKCAIAKKGNKDDRKDIINFVCDDTTENNGFYLRETDKEKKNIVSLFEYAHKPEEHKKDLDDLCKVRTPKDKTCNIPKSFYDDYKDIKSLIKEQIELCRNPKQRNNEVFTDLSKLKHPGVKTYIIANRSYQTIGGFTFTDANDKTLERDEIYYVGGDGTVQGDSPIYAGLKWIEDRKNNPKLPKATILDFCAPVPSIDTFNKDKVNNADALKYYYESFADFSNSKKSDYLFLDCKCKSKSFYKTDGILGGSNIAPCNHVDMLSDPNILNFISDISIGNNIPSYEDKNLDFLEDYDEETPLNKCHDIFSQTYFKTLFKRNKKNKNKNKKYSRRFSRKN